MYSAVINKLLDTEMKLKKIAKKDSQIKNKILKLCQEVFNEFKNPPILVKDDVDSFENYTAYKKKILGNMILIAHIFMTVKIIKLVTLSSIIKSFYDIIKAKDSTENAMSNCYEGLCTLFTIIGRKVDTQSQDMNVSIDKGKEGFIAQFNLMIKDFMEVSSHKILST